MGLSGFSRIRATARIAGKVSTGIDLVRGLLAAFAEASDGQS